MLSEQLSLPHLVEFPASPPGAPPSLQYPAILALHGRGSNETDLIGLAPHLPPGLLWVSPRAPLLLGPGSYEWYRVRTIGMPEPEQLHAALQTIDGFLDEVTEAYPIDPHRFFLLGFSQGSILSMSYALTHPERVAGVVAQSGYLPSNVDLQIDEAGVRGKPFLLTHGEQDTMIPVEWGRASRDRLQQFGIDLTYHEFSMGHSVSIESLEVVSAWLQQHLKQ